MKRYALILLGAAAAAACAGTEPTTTDGPDFAGKGKPPTPAGIATIVSLGTLGGNGSEAMAINEARQVVGTSDLPGGGRHAFIWTAAEGMRDLGVLPGETDSDAYDINESGVVVGVSGGQVVRWDPVGSGYGVPTVVLVPGGFAWAPLAINDASMITGTSGSPGHVFLSVNGVATDIHPFAATTSSTAEGINNAGTVIGFGSGSGSNNVGFSRTLGGTVEVLAGIGGPDTDPIDINSSGVIVGVSSNISHATLWSNGVPSDLGTLGGSGSAAIALNDANPIQVVGTSATGGRRASTHAFIWTAAAGMRDLGVPKGVSVARPEDISDNGWVVGWTESGSGFKAILWKLATAAP